MENQIVASQPEDTISDAILICFGVIGGAIVSSRKSKSEVKK